MARCKGITVKGKDCQRKGIINGFCFLHAPIDPTWHTFKTQLERFHLYAGSAIYMLELIRLVRHLTGHSQLRVVYEGKSHKLDLDAMEADGERLAKLRNEQADSEIDSATAADLVSMHEKLRVNSLILVAHITSIAMGAAAVSHVAQASSRS